MSMLLCKWQTAISLCGEREQTRTDGVHAIASVLNIVYGNGLATR